MHIFLPLKRWHTKFVLPSMLYLKLVLTCLSSPSYTLTSDQYWLSRNNFGLGQNKSNFEEQRYHVYY